MTSDTKDYSLKLKKNLYILFFVAISLVPSLFAQTDTVINGRRYKMVEETTESKSKKHHPPTDSIFVLNNKKLKYYNSWLTGGAGIQKNLTYKQKNGFAGGVDFNFHIKYYYFQLGATITGERFGYYNNYQFHLGYGKRFEDKDFHIAGFAGISYSSGYHARQLDSIRVETRSYAKPGLYLQAEIVKKLTYDVGAGISLFADWNQEQAIIGSRFILYFSGAYKGKKH